MRAARPPVFVVAGATASGKSAFADALAHRIGGEIVNADSVQLYKAFRVLTARPDAAAERRLPHRLYGILEPDERCSAGRWRTLAMDALAASAYAGRPAVVVGGSGFYIEALLEGIAFIPEVPEADRRRAMQCLDALGPVALHAELRKVDPALAARLQPRDRQRIVRGWEVWLATGRPLSAWQADARPAADFAYHRILLQPPRAAVRAAIEERVGRMLEDGALDEVRAFAQADVPADAPIRKAHGLRPLTRHLRGEITLEDAAALTVNETRQYARRQATWFRGRYAADRVLDVPPDAVVAEAEALAREMAMA